MARITANEYDRKVQELKKKERDIYEQLKDHSKADEEFLISSSYILELAHNGYSLFKSSQTAKKREILNFVFANFQADGSKLLYKTKEPFWELLFCAESWKWLSLFDWVGTQIRTLTPNEKLIKEDINRINYLCSEDSGILKRIIENANLI